MENNLHPNEPIWKKLFTRSGFQYFILHMAQEAYANDMEATLGWGYKDQLFIYEDSIVTSFYSEEDAQSFKTFIAQKTSAEIIGLLKIIDERIIDLQRAGEDAIALLNTIPNQNVLMILENIYQAYRNLYAVYRFPTLIDLETEGLNQKLLEACARTKDRSGIALNFVDYKVIPILKKNLGILLNCDEKIVLNLNFSELKKSILENKLSVPEDNLLQRTRYLILVTINRTLHLHEGEQAKIWLETQNLPAMSSGDFLIKGRTAYTGIITGNVFLPKYIEDLKDMPKQSILVMPMTTVETSKYLHNVIGIITDEGGITCHAAIISREMKIPCVVGTKNATSILKNGDQVLLDATSGVVKKLVL